MSSLLDLKPIFRIIKQTNSKNRMRITLDILDLATDEERREMFSEYCVYCGVKQKDALGGFCVCWRDE